jgi:hypothetical protein
MTTYATTSYSTQGSERTETKYRTNTTLLEGEVISTQRQKATKTIAVDEVKAGPYTEAEAETLVAGGSSNTIAGDGSGTIVNVMHSRTNAAGMCYVYTITETHSAWSSWSNV